jgi:hypothetical protein
VSTVLKKITSIISSFPIKLASHYFLNIWYPFRGQNQKKLTPSNEEISTLSLQINVPQPINSMPIFAETLKFKQQTLAKL